MPRYIDADALKIYINDCEFCTNCPNAKPHCSYNCKMPDCLTSDWERVIAEQPTADVRENRKGKWIEFEENIEGLRYKIKRCSVCGATKPMKIFENEDFAFNFCTNCGSYNGGNGAEMRTGE